LRHSPPGIVCLEKPNSCKREQILDHSHWFSDDPVKGTAMLGTPMWLAQKMMTA
jgi:hypothetical protein